MRLVAFFRTLGLGCGCGGGFVRMLGECGSECEGNGRYGCCCWLRRVQEDSCAEQGR